MSKLKFVDIETDITILNCQGEIPDKNVDVIINDAKYEIVNIASCYDIDNSFHTIFIKRKKELLNEESTIGTCICSSNVNNDTCVCGGCSK